MNRLSCRHGNGGGEIALNAQMVGVLSPGTVVTHSDQAFTVLHELPTLSMQLEHFICFTIVRFCTRVHVVLL